MKYAACICRTSAQHSCFLSSCRHAVWYGSAASPIFASTTGDDNDAAPLFITNYKSIAFRSNRYYANGKRDDKPTKFHQPKAIVVRVNFVYCSTTDVHTTCGKKTSVFLFSMCDSKRLSAYLYKTRRRKH